MSKLHEDEIDKICMDLKKLIMKQDHTPTEIECIHDYAEVIYYLTVTDAMNKAEKDGGFSMAMDGRAMRMTPIYDYAMGDESMRRGRRGSYDGRAGRDNDNDGRYSEHHMPYTTHNWEGERYPERY